MDNEQQYDHGHPANTTCYTCGKKVYFYSDIMYHKLCNLCRGELNEYMEKMRKRNSLKDANANIN